MSNWIKLKFKSYNFNKWKMILLNSENWEIFIEFLIIVNPELCVEAMAKPAT